jgi:hypothetical protein
LAEGRTGLDFRAPYEGVVRRIAAFCQAYLRGKMELHARDGKLDDMPDNLIRMYVSGEMKPGRESGRGR